MACPVQLFSHKKRSKDLDKASGLAQVNDLLGYTTVTKT